LAALALRAGRTAGPAPVSPPACRTLETVPGDLRVNNWLVIPAGELRERFSRSSGPGGQSVNTADSRAELSFDIAGSPTLPAREKNRALSRLAGRLTSGVVTVAAETERSQLMNREAARDRLAALLREAIAPPPPPRVPTKPSRGARERRLADKRRRAQTKRQRRPDPGDQ
jgi:ribosome-associated protein